MEVNTLSPPVATARKAVLLCFLPPATSREAVQERTFMTTFSQGLQQRLPDLVRVLNVDQTAHPDVVNSFNLTQLPALVLVHHGVERWRQEGVRAWEERTLLPHLLERIKAL
ncbi:thioredoxin [Fibrella sp. WM1]|uniref:thioredoxin n=1 Tax=Fibrella musci TaxID=3242485 RepID=UPI0035223286